jgi:hypothetical protein
MIVVLNVRVGKVLADCVNRIREIVRVAGLAVRNGNSLELGSEFRLIHYAAGR